MSILAASLPSVCDVIHLKNGKKLRVERTWNEGDKVRYEKNGNIFGFSKDLVAKVESGVCVPDPQDITVQSQSSRKSISVEVLDETLDISKGFDLSRSEVIKDGSVNHKQLNSIESGTRREPKDLQKRIRYLNALRDVILWHVNHNDLASALSFMDPYLRLNPEDLQANLTLAWVYLKQGQYQRAQDVLLRVKIKNDRSPELLYLLGVAYYLQDKNEEAGRMLRQSLELDYRAEVEQLLQKVEQENRTENAYKQANSLHFVIRYEGSSTNVALGQGILASLEHSFSELENQLDFSPRESIVVVLYPDEVFRDLTKTPSWVGALNDGKIRFPIKGLSFVNDKVRRILKHELTHSFLRLKTGGNCPLWLNEGLAQFLSGESSQPFLPVAKQAIARDGFPPLSSLEGSFLSLGDVQASWAYQESLLATEFMVRSFGLSEIQTILERTGQTGNFQAALKVALQKDYTQLQREFEEYVKRQ
jgi:TolA-binding protein